MPPGLAAALADDDNDEPISLKPSASPAASSGIRLDSVHAQSQTGTTQAMRTRSKEIKGSSTASPAWIWAVIFGLFGLSFLFYKLYP
jgi:hypothetical protein